MIEFKNVTKKFGERRALENISLRVRKGEIFTLMGPNGSGKTTVLRIMAGIDSPTSGEVYFNGERVNENNLEEISKQSTLVFQRTALFNTTVYKNVAYGLKLRGYPKKEIEEKVGVPIGILSTGPDATHVIDLRENI